MSLVGCFEIIVHDDGLVSANMSTGQRKAFCVLRFSKCESGNNRATRFSSSSRDRCTDCSKAHVDGINTFQIHSVRAKEKPKGRLRVSEYNVESIGERVFNVVHVSQPTTQAENSKSLKQLFGGFWDGV